VTQETEFFSPGVKNQTTADEENISIDDSFIHENAKGIPDWVKPTRWYRSNSGGMALEEAQSRTVAMRNEYALSIGFTRKEELPENLIPYYSNEYFIEVRVLYENGGQKRRQWILRDRNGTSRVVGVFSEPGFIDSDEGDEPNEKKMSGFIEIYDANSYLICEYNFFNNGVRTRKDYTFKDNLLISSTVSLWEENDNIGGYVESYADLLRYNRSLYLRAAERVFYRERIISLSDEPVKVSFPRNLSNVSLTRDLAGERLISYPGFFGEVIVQKDDRIVYVTNEKSSILSQTLYGDTGEIIWVINNTWSNDRITSTLKKEGGDEYLAEFDYDADGNRITERNFKNGILERVVHTEGNTDIEELYINNMIVLRAVWENGRKISETRVENR
jgi:antitoxin component YwqK of YwqJK toxin-antitoxin module